MKELILMQDDCAPDAREYFEKDLVKITGMTIGEFQHQHGEPDMEDEMHMEWIHEDYVLSYDGDDPWYKLHKVVI